MLTIRVSLVGVVSVCSMVSMVGCAVDDENPADDSTESETGDLSDETGDANGEGSCGEQTESVLDDLTAIPPGFELSVEAQLALITGEFAGTFVWADAEGPWTATHAGTSSPLAASLGYSNGVVRLVEVEYAGEEPNEGGFGTCANYLVVDMDLEFDTEDGVFAEAMTVAVTIPGPAAEAEPDIYHPLDLDAMMGTLSADDFLAAEGMITDVVLTGSLGEDSLNGSLGIGVEVSDGPDGISGFGFIASFTSTKAP